MHISDLPVIKLPVTYYTRIFNIQRKQRIANKHSKLVCL